ncbi:MAG: hypothetical protein IKB15_02540, partial [Alistipes sp.]|nr:hypothetical protein [Alistipes sp.]
MNRKSILSLVVLMVVTVALLSAAGNILFINVGGGDNSAVDDAAMLGGATEPSTTGKRMVDLKADDAYYISKGDSTIFILVGNFAAHHNGAVIMADSAVRYSNQSFECFGNVLINQNNTYVYGNRAEYNNQTATATVYSDLVKIVDGEAVMYTYNCKFNTDTEIGEFSGGCYVHKGDSHMESERGFYNTKTHDLTAVRRVEMRDDTYQMRGDSVIFNTETENARYFTNSNIWNDKDEYLYADAGSYEKARDFHHLTRNAYILSPEREIWSDSIEYYRIDNHIIGRRNIQVDDTEQKMLGFADYGEWWDEPGNALFTGRPSMINYDNEQQDSVYLSADTLWMYTIAVLPPDSVVKDSLAAETETPLNDSLASESVVEEKDKRQERQERREERREERQERREERREERETKRMQREAENAEDESTLVEEIKPEGAEAEGAEVEEQHVDVEHTEVVEQPTHAEAETIEPTETIAEPAVTEQPIVADKQDVVAEPSVVEESTVVAERAIEEETVTEQSAVVEEPVAVESPATEESIVDKNPIVEEIVANESSAAEEPIVTEIAVETKSVDVAIETTAVVVEDEVVDIHESDNIATEEPDTLKDTTTVATPEIEQPEFRGGYLGTMTLAELAERQSYLPEPSMVDGDASAQEADITQDSVAVEEPKVLTEREQRREAKRVEQIRRDSAKAQRIALRDSLKGAENYLRDSLRRLERIERDSLKAIEQAERDSLYKLKYGERDSLRAVERYVSDSLTKIKIDSIVAKRIERSSRIADEEKARMERIMYQTQERQRIKIEKAKARAARRGKEYKGPELEDLFPDGLINIDSLNAADAARDSLNMSHDHD